MSTAVATAIQSDDGWPKIILASLLNHLSFTRAIKTLEPILAPLRDSQGSLGSTPSRIWSVREWRVIKIMSFGMSITLTAAHLASRETEPYFLIGGSFIYLAINLVATGLSPRTPQGKWQFLSVRTADILKEFPPFQHLPSSYKASISLFTAVLILLWMLYVGLEQALPWFIRWTLSTLPVVKSAVHAIKRDIPSNTGSEWGSSMTSAVIGAGVTLACHVHRTLLDQNQRNADNAINEQQRAESEKLTATLSRLALLAERILGPVTEAVEAHQLIAALDQQLVTPTSTLLPSATSTLHHHSANSQACDVSGDSGMALGSGADCIEINKLPAASAPSDRHDTPVPDAEGSMTALHTGRREAL